MAGRESVEDKIARIVNDAIASRDRKAAEEKDPNKAWLRQAIREEVATALEGLLGDRGDAGKAGGKGREEGDDGGILGLFGG